MKGDPIETFKILEELERIDTEVVSLAGKM